MNPFFFEEKSMKGDIDIKIFYIFVIIVYQYIDKKALA